VLDPVPYSIHYHRIWLLGDQRSAQGHAVAPRRCNGRASNETQDCGTGAIFWNGGSKAWSRSAPSGLDFR
jgi:hypothetical protein